MKSTKLSNKKKMSISISSYIYDLLEDETRAKTANKSQIVESALRSMFKSKLEDDAKKLSKIKFDDLPSEDDWLAIQNETL